MGTQCKNLIKTILSHEGWNYSLEMKNIQWKDVKGYEGLYKISENGDVMSSNYKQSNKPGLLTPSVTGIGYVFYRLAKNRKRKCFYAHRLVAEHFISKHSQPETLEVNHLDGDKTNNQISNLEWCTHSENVKHSFDSGLRITAYKKHYGSRQLTEEEVVKIREVYKNENIKMSHLAKKYGVSIPSIHNVIRRNTYKNVL